MAKFDVDFPHVRENADIVAVMAHYNISLNGEGEQRKGPCPLHEDTRNSLSVNTAKNVFRCHSCGSSGNVIKFVELVDAGLGNPRLAALQIAKLSQIPPKPGDKVEGAARAAETEAASAVVVENDAASSDEPVVVDRGDGVPCNRPLTFQLQLAPIVSGGESVVNRFVVTQGLSYEHLAELGIGLGQRGSMKDRLAIPIRNADGDLVAYCGRDVGLLEEADPERYKFPEKFNRELEIYGWDEAQQFEQIVVVEDILAVVKHAEAAAHYGEQGSGVVALMGQHISDAQIELLLQTCPDVIVCLWGDSARELQGMSVATHLANAGLWVTIRSCPGGKPPESIDSEAFCRACCVE